MSVATSMEYVKEQAGDVAVMCADIQYNPGSTPSAFLGTAAVFGGISAGAFLLASRIDGTSPAQRIKKASAITVGVGASGLACLDVTSYVGHRLKGTAPDDEPTVIARALDTDMFQMRVVDSKFAPIRFVGAGIVVAHAFAQGILEPNYGQSSD